jgi:DNA invertase Pin-like site-specific DNA recombinase
VRAAIYARKSTDQSGVSEDAKSVTRQVEQARAYTERKGWTVAEEHIYTDDGISGAEFLKRPGFLRLMNAAEQRPRPFDVLVMSEESRLGREQVETAYTVKRLTDWGVRIFLYLDDRERTLDGAMDKVMLSLSSFASEMERERASQRTYDAMVRKAKNLQVTGGKVYGFRHISYSLRPYHSPKHATRPKHAVRTIPTAHTERTHLAADKVTWSMIGTDRGTDAVSPSLAIGATPGTRYAKACRIPTPCIGLVTPSTPCSTPSFVSTGSR